MWATCLNLSALGGSPVGAGSESDHSVAGRFDAVILAGQDPKSTLHRIRLIRRFQPEVPVITLYRGNRLEAQEVGALGGIEQVHRPAPRKALLRAVEECLRRRPDSNAVSASHQILKDSCAGVRVLVVEDDPATANIHRMMLAWLGCMVGLASKSSEALDLVSSQPWDIVFVDGQLTGMDGVELTRSIRRQDGVGQRTPVVAVSGDGSSDWRARFFEAGVDDYLLKPVTGDEFRQVIRIYSR